jgi:hypothetical protein
MKNKAGIMAIAVSMLVVFGLVWGVKGAVAAPAYPQIGDANGDGTINMGDVTRTELGILGLAPFTSWADANWDGTVNMADVIYIEKIIMGMAEVIHP